MFGSSQLFGDWAQGPGRKAPGLLHHRQFQNPFAAHSNQTASSRSRVWLSSAEVGRQRRELLGSMPAKPTKTVKTDENRLKTGGETHENRENRQIN